MFIVRVVAYHKPGDIDIWENAFTNRAQAFAYAREERMWESCETVTIFGELDMLAHWEGSFHVR